MLRRLQVPAKTPLPPELRISTSLASSPTSVPPFKTSWIYRRPRFHSQHLPRFPDDLRTFQLRRPPPPPPPPTCRRPALPPKLPGPPPQRRPPPPPPKGTLPPRSKPASARWGAYCSCPRSPFAS